MCDTRVRPPKSRFWCHHRLPRKAGEFQLGLGWEVLGQCLALQAAFRTLCTEVAASPGPAWRPLPLLAGTPRAASLCPPGALSLTRQQLWPAAWHSHPGPGHKHLGRQPPRECGPCSLLPLSQRNLVSRGASPPLPPAWDATCAQPSCLCKASARIAACRCGGLRPTVGLPVTLSLLVPACESVLPLRNKLHPPFKSLIERPLLSH